MLSFILIDVVALRSDFIFKIKSDRRVFMFDCSEPSGIQEAGRKVVSLTVRCTIIQRQSTQKDLRTI